MTTAKRIRSSRTLLTILVIAGIASLGAFECFKILHDIHEPDCDGRHAGHRFACFLCAHGTFVSAELTPEVDIPIPEQATLLGLSEDLVAAPVWTAVDHPGRSPPPVS